MLQGPTSSGKTSLVEYLATRTGHRFVRINNHEHTDLQEYLGSYVTDAEGAFSGPETQEFRFRDVRVFFLFSSTGVRTPPRRGVRLPSLFPVCLEHHRTSGTRSLLVRPLRGRDRAGRVPKSVRSPRTARAYRRRRRKTRRSVKSALGPTGHIFFISPRARSPFFSFCSFAARARAVCVSCRF